MGHWNYRICKETIQDETSFTVREVYYNKKGEIWGSTVNGASPYGESFREIMGDLARMLAAGLKPVINLDTLVYASSDSPPKADYIALETKQLEASYVS